MRVESTSPLSLERRSLIDEDKDRAFINAMAKKYLGQDVFPRHQPEDERVIMVVQLQHTTNQNIEEVSHLSKKGSVADAKEA